MKCFIVSDFENVFPEVRQKTSNWIADKKLSNTETTINGFDQIPTAIISLFEGKNEGKLIVTI